MVGFSASGPNPTKLGLVRANTPGDVEPEVLPEFIVVPEEAPLELPEDAPEAAPLDAPAVEPMPLAVEPELGVPPLVEPVPPDAVIPEGVPVPEPELAPVVPPLPEPLLFPDPAEEPLDEHPASPSTKRADAVPAESRHNGTRPRERRCSIM